MGEGALGIDEWRAFDLFLRPKFTLSGPFHGLAGGLVAPGQRKTACA
jgi:hypothetical protein